MILFHLFAGLSALCLGLSVVLTSLQDSSMALSAFVSFVVFGVLAYLNLKLDPTWRR